MQIRRKYSCSISEHELNDIVIGPWSGLLHCDRWITKNWSPTVPVSVWLPEPVRDRGSKQKTLNDDFYHTTSRSAVIYGGQGGLSYLVLALTLWIALCPMERSSGVWSFGDVSVTYRRSFGNHTLAGALCSGNILPGPALVSQQFRCFTGHTYIGQPHWSQIFSAIPCHASQTWCDWDLCSWSVFRIITAVEYEVLCNFWDTSMANITYINITYINDCTVAYIHALDQSLVQAQIKENIKAPRHWPLWGESTGDRSPHKGTVTRKIFSFDDVIMGK